MDTLSKEVLLAYEYLEIETISNDFIIIDGSPKLQRNSTMFWMSFFGSFIFYQISNYYTLELIELILLMVAVIGYFLFFRYKKKLCLNKIKFDATSGAVIYENLFMKKEFIFSEMKLIKKDARVSTGRSGYDATFFYLEDKKNKKKYSMGHFFRSQDKDLDFLKLINSFMLEKDRNKLKIIPYQRENEFD